MWRHGAAPIPASCPTTSSPACRCRARRRITTRRSGRPPPACSSPPPPAPTCRRAAARASSASPPPAAPAAASSPRRLAEGEVETLYVLDDWRDRGVGRKLMRAAAGASGGDRLQVLLRLGAARQPEPLVLPAPRRQAGGRGDDPVRRPEGAADRLRLGPDRAIAGRLAARILEPAVAAHPRRWQRSSALSPGAAVFAASQETFCCQANI